ncbi:STAS domain-containing protein [Candidatus Peregrinibacteria bacterium]|nr:MAG: STAS domain-containing protein [Candidatus Peregrinibacteria bacterium]
MQPLTITIQVVEGKEKSHLVRFSGAFDGHTKEVATSLERLINEMTEGTLIFDFSELVYLNSYAIGHIVSWHNVLKQKKCEIIIASLNKNVEDIFNVLGIISLFRVFADVDSALQAL